MRVLHILFLSYLLFLSRASAQTSFEEADELFNTKQYSVALPIYHTLLKANQVNAGLNYKIGICYLKSRSQKHKAAGYLEKAVEYTTSFYTHGPAKETDAPTEVYKFLGEAYQFNQKFDAAIVSYQKYKEAMQPDKEKYPNVCIEMDKKIEMCRYAEEIKDGAALPPNIKFDDIIKNNGSALGEFSSALSTDKTSMVYTLKVPVSLLKTNDDLKYFEPTALPVVDTTHKAQSTAVSKKNSKGNKDTIVNITTIGASVDGQVVLTYRDDKGDAGLFVSRLKANIWSAPKKLPKTVNDKGWEPNEFMTPDGNLLFFTSDRPGGYGGKDIYMCKKLPNGEWSKASNLGATVNSPYDEEAPFFHPDGTTFYFSSNRNNPDNSFDIYSCSLSGNTWSKPLIVGYPVDSGSDNDFYQVSSDKKKIFSPKTPATLSLKEIEKKNKKNRKDSIIESKKVEKDIYMITFSDQNKSELTLLKGEITDLLDQLTSPVEITVTDNESGKIQGIYYTHSKTGTYLFALPNGRNNNVTYSCPGYLFQSKNYPVKNSTNYFEKHEVLKLQPIAEGSKITLNNTFFESGKASILPTSNTELNKLYDLLNSDKTIKAVVTHFIFTKENAKQNKLLSETRAQAVVKYLTEKGIDAKRLEAKGVQKSEQASKDKTKKKTTTDQTIQMTEFEIEKIEDTPKKH